MTCLPGLYSAVAMKVKHIKNNGRKVWMVDGTIDGKRECQKEHPDVG